MLFILYVIYNLCYLLQIVQTHEAICHALFFFIVTYGLEFNLQHLSHRLQFLHYTLPPNIHKSVIKSLWPLYSTLVPSYRPPHTYCLLLNVLTVTSICLVLSIKLSPMDCWIVIFALTYYIVYTRENFYLHLLYTNTTVKQEYGQIEVFQLNELLNINQNSTLILCIHAFRCLALYGWQQFVSSSTMSWQLNTCTAIATCIAITGQPIGKVLQANIKLALANLAVNYIAFYQFEFRHHLDTTLYIIDINL